MDYDRENYPRGRAYRQLKPEIIAIVDASHQSGVLEGRCRELEKLNHKLDTENEKLKSELIDSKHDNKLWQQREAEHRKTIQDLQNQIFKLKDKNLKKVMAKK